MEPEEVNGSTSQFLQNGGELLQSMIFSSDPDKTVSLSPRISEGFVLWAERDDSLLSDFTRIILISLILHIHGYTPLTVFPIEGHGEVVVSFRWLSVEAS